MYKFRCPLCEGETKRNGKTSAGKTRWRCKNCNYSWVGKRNKDPAYLKLFLDWLLSKKTQSEMGMSARSFRRRTSYLWKYVPLPPFCDEIHHVLYVDGIWISKNFVILIACTDTHVVSWRCVEVESSKTWSEFLAQIAPPDVVIVDGSSGFEKARKEYWPNTRVQRCVFHVFCQVKRQTTTKPKLEAGKELYALAKALLYVKTSEQASKWLVEYAEWCARWHKFLNEREIINGVKRYKHRRLRSARTSLNKIINSNTLFTYLDEKLLLEGPIPSTNNQIEGGVNCQLRSMIRNHRGLKLDRRVKAVFWWCYTHSEYMQDFQTILKDMPTENMLKKQLKADSTNNDTDIPGGFGTGIDWNDYHIS